MRSLLDILAFSSLWAAAVAAALSAAAAAAMGVPTVPAAIGLAVAGTLVVYNVDRLRDVERDRATSPDRSAFVTANRPWLVGLCSASAAVALFCGASLGPAVWALCAVVLAVGLLHRRLKRVPVFKGLYITSSWVAVVVGVPALASGGARHGVWVSAVLGAAILANVIASSLRDAESAAAWLGSGNSLATARLIAVAGLAVALLGPGTIAPLGLVPMAVLIGLVRYRPGERYGLVVVDGSLIAGGLASLTLPQIL